MVLFYEAIQYQEQCNHLYQQYYKQLLTLMPTARIEHIGSSAIPNAISKGDLDIYVEVVAQEFDQSLIQIKTLQFQEKLETLRTLELCMLESMRDHDVAIQLVVRGSEFESFLVFRDRLISSNDLVEQYNQLKLGCAKLNMDQYRRKKSEFIQYVLNL